ncbi:50S ribosomal protein L11 methyltransferase [Verrucomicrobia bacterium]|nr:50S ribosomal protein L11 methyltransferase [Verrucomicrobiota bacterium]
MIKASHPIEPDAVENLEDALYELAPSNWSLIVSQKDGTGDLEGFFDSEKDARLALEELESILGQAFEKPFRLDELADRDWKESYKAHFKAWSRGTIHWVPEWKRESYEIPEGHHALYVDPGMAFGTGNHETTRLCLESMISICEGKKFDDCIDLGCGSGILSLSAFLLGIEKIKAIDFDPDAIKVAHDNAALNQMNGIVDFKAQRLETLDEDQDYDLVLANIQADVLMQNAERLLGLVRKGGSLVLSGILTDEMKFVEDCFLNLLQMEEKYFEIDKKSLGEWSLLQLMLKA